MAAMMVATAPTAFADKGGGGHTFPGTGDFNQCITGVCDITGAHAGRNGSTNGLGSFDLSLNAPQNQGSFTLTLEAEVAAAAAEVGATARLPLTF